MPPCSHSRTKLLLRVFAPVVGASLLHALAYVDDLPRRHQVPDNNETGLPMRKETWLDRNIGRLFWAAVIVLVVLGIVIGFLKPGYRFHIPETSFVSPTVWAA